MREVPVDATEHRLTHNRQQRQLLPPPSRHSGAANRSRHSGAANRGRHSGAARISVFAPLPLPLLVLCLSFRSAAKESASSFALALLFRREQGISLRIIPAHAPSFWRSQNLRICPLPLPLLVLCLSFRSAAESASSFALALLFRREQGPSGP
jgi:hypothetical protein